MFVSRSRTVLALLALSAASHAFIDDALEVIKFGKEIGEEVLSSWDVLGKPFNASGGVELPLLRRREREILGRLKVISHALANLELSMEKTGAMVEVLQRASGRGARLELRLHELSDLVGRVAAADRSMREFVAAQREFERSTLENFAAYCVSHDAGALPELLERIHSLVAPPHHNLLARGIFQLVLDDVQEEHPDLCELQLSPHQLIYDMYNSVTLTEIKGYAMMQFSWMLLRIYGKGNYTQEASMTRRRYAERSSRTANAARTALTMARRDLYRCDPSQHVEGESFAQVTRLLQGYIENEVDMSEDRSCRENCAHYTVAQSRGCYQDQYCAQQRQCAGRIFDCHYIDSDMNICPARSKSNRRYEWIEYENGRSFGKMGECKRGYTKVDSWWRISLFHCSYCMCLCEDAASEAERFFSLRDVVADMRANKIVTGLRLVKLGRVFHLQISEGVLGERGAVTPGDWVPVQQFDPSDAGVSQGLDYHMLTYEKRAIDLDELDSPQGHILTGVRFRMLGAHLNFEIRSTPFSYTTGRLSADKSQWISNDNTDGTEHKRVKLELYRPDIPRGLSPLPVDSRHDQFVEFVNSDFEADVAQSTVPFIDIQPIQPLKGASMFSGAGVIHRGARGSGGYVAVKLLTYDYSRHVHAEPPPAAPEGGDDTTEFSPIVN